MKFLVLAIIIGAVIMLSKRLAKATDEPQGPAGPSA